MASRRDVTKKFAREYAKADRAEKSRILDALVASTGWTRDHARRAIRAAATRKGAARDQQRKPRPRKYSYDALIVLQEVWRLAGQPSGKYLAVVMEDTLCRLVRDRELGKVADRVSDTVIDELRSMSAATIDRYLKPHKAAGYPAAGLSSFTFLSPVFGVLGGGLLLDEPLSWRIFAALAMIAVGLLLVNRPVRRGQPG